MLQKLFAESVKTIIREDELVIGLAAGGSWITDELDEYSDLDLLLITQKKISDDKDNMMVYANKFGSLISAFTGEHVGEPRVLICLYENPLLHVDIKFLTLPEFYHRIEDPVILFEREDQLSQIIKETKASWPALDFQWIEDRFWTWIHYACLKIGRGELLEAIDFLAYLRMIVLSPLLLLKNKQFPRGLRKVEMILPEDELSLLTTTLTIYDKASIIKALNTAVQVYKNLREEVFSSTIKLNLNAERLVLAYLENLK